MRLDELIAQTTPLPFKWVSDTTGIFTFRGVEFSIILEPIDPVKLSHTIMTGLNIAFGVTNENNNETPINTDLTGMHSPRVIMATVAHAVLEKLSSIHTKYNYITLLSKSDNVNASRAKIYRAAIIDVADQLDHFGYEYPYQIAGNSNNIMLISKVELTHQEAEYICKVENIG